MANDGVHRHAFWVYGVIVGLAIQQALTDLVPHLFAPPHETFSVEFHEGVRVSIFLIVITRFYLGAASFFDEAHAADPGKFKRRSYPMDFLFGFFHFLVFFVWAVTLNPHKMPQNLFNYLLWVILGYDTIWYFACRQYDTRHLMKLWTALNLFTLVLSLLFFFGSLQAGWRFETAEEIALLPVLVASLIDLMELVTGKAMIKNWLANLIHIPA
ncbi:MAG TPA: hypothetical protein VFA59_11250 [Vicinamibacterales bacterium]|nr:hypothetical protein [Vicinamibacterales bacterium]